MDVDLDLYAYGSFTHWVLMIIPPLDRRVNPRPTNVKMKLSPTHSPQKSHKPKTRLNYCPFLLKPKWILLLNERIPLLRLTVPPRKSRYPSELLLISETSVLRYR